MSESSSALLEGSRLLVTGGSGGIGRGICQVAARLGARVGFTWLENAAGSRDTEEKVRAQGAECEPIQVDLRTAEGTDRALRAVTDRWGGIDVLINAAGMSQSMPFVLLEDEDIAGVLELNFMAPVRLIRGAARVMIQQKFGRIVSISSIAASRSVPGPVHYALSKGALEGMTRSLAHELGPYGILVNAIAGGLFEGGLRSTIPEHHQHRYLDACSLGRIGQPAECGELACWLASRANTYVNGTIVYQDGATLA
jgi:3-oxoacyl-[acyl-carrier protein] reductase